MLSKLNCVFPLFSTIFLLQCIAAYGSVRNTSPVITSVKLVNKTLIPVHSSSRLNFLLHLQGSDFYDNMPIRITTDTQQSNPECSSLSSESSYSFSQIVLNKTQCFLNVTLTDDAILSGKPLYLCIGDQFRTSGHLFNFNDEVIKWIHQGETTQFELESDNLVYDYDSSIQMK